MLLEELNAAGFPVAINAQPKLIQPLRCSINESLR
jgi:phosphoserine phosphatase